VTDRWITDDIPSQRFPYYTRANADEVGPDPFSPLGWSLGWKQGCIPGVAKGFVDWGACRWSELREDSPEVFGNWGGYFYNQLSLPRVSGARTPGGSAEMTDRAYFGDHPGVPPYVPHPDDDAPDLGERILKKITWVLTTDGYPEMDEESERAREFHNGRPDLSSYSDAELVQRGRDAAPMIADAWFPYCLCCFASGIVSGTLTALCEAIGRGDAALALLAAVGNVESADASFRMWDLSRSIAGSPELTAAFDAGVDDVLDRLRASGSADATAWVAGFDELIRECGHRGPNEWDMRPHSWETMPSYPLGMIDRLRHQDDQRSPHAAAEKAATERVRLTAELTEATAGDPDVQAQLLGAIRAAGVWFPLRERGKNTCIREIHEAKLAFMELGRRMTERGVIADPQRIFMLLDSEIDAFLENPLSFTATIDEREATFLELHDLVPPYIVFAGEPIPPISEWPRRGANDKNAISAAVGEVLQGGAGAPGIVTGRARVVLDPADPGDLDPTDIMVVHTTDPSWTPLFLSVGGVVCNVGAVASHAAIVCRELGVPCAVSVVDATLRIPDGATISVDGTTGSVTVVSLV